MEIKVLHQVMDWNEDVSEEVKGTLAEHHICMVNVMGSPGAGKTSMITTLIGKLRDTFRVGVIEGDIAARWTRSASLLSACPPSSSTRTGPATSRP